MNILLGYANSLSRDFAQNHLSGEESGLNVMTAGSFADCLQLAPDFKRLDLIGLDLEMPDMDGVHGFREMRKATADRVPVAVMGASANSRLINDFLLAGAAGYLPYSMSADALLGAIRLIIAGEIFVPAGLTADNHTPDNANQLTKREREVLDGLLSGKSNREIAQHLSLSEVTVKHHLKGLRSKLGAKNRTHAVCRAIALGMG